MRCTLGHFSCLLALSTAATTPVLGAQAIRYDALTNDSVALLGDAPVRLPSGDTALVFMYRTFLPLGDTTPVRKQALGWWPVVSADVKVRGYGYAVILVVWAKIPSDSLLALGPAARYTLPFVRDTAGCWHLMRDTTEVSTCSSLSR